MNYPIKVLQQKIVEHRTAIMVLKEQEGECYAGYLFIEEEIKSHENCISELNEAIIKLMKDENSKDK